MQYYLKAVEKSPTQKIALPFRVQLNDLKIDNFVKQGEEQALFQYQIACKLWKTNTRSLNLKRLKAFFLLKWNNKSALTGVGR